MAARQTVVIVSVILSISGVLFAVDEQQPGGTGGASVPAPQLAFPQAAPKNPYTKLFAGTAVAAQGPLVQNQAEQTQPARPKVVCGMMVMPADASIDPRMRVSPPVNDNTTHTIRAVKPPMCTSD